MTFTHLIDTDNLRYSNFTTEVNAVVVTVELASGKPVVSHINIPMGVINNVRSFIALQHEVEMHAEELYKGVAGHPLANAYSLYVEQATATGASVMPIAAWAAWKLGNGQNTILKQMVGRR